MAWSASGVTPAGPILPGGWLALPAGGVTPAGPERPVGSLTCGETQQCQDHSQQQFGVVRDPGILQKPLLVQAFVGTGW